MNVTTINYCSKCSSTSTILLRLNRDGETFQERQCLDCGHRFKVGGEPQKQTIMNGKVTYGQNWTAYNEAQCNEKEWFLRLSRDLIDSLGLEPVRRVGRPRLEVDDALFCLLVKAYNAKSSRRTVSELKLLQQQGQIRQEPHFNSLLNYLNETKLTSILKQLVYASALPLKEVEQDFAIDSSGFSTSIFSRWFDHKWGIEKDQRVWVKAHVMVGTKTNVISSVEITEGHSHDINQFRPLFNQTMKDFNVEEVSADKAYLSKKTIELAVENNVKPFIPFKSNTTMRSRGSQPWKQCHLFFRLHQQEFLNHYHKRSNVETVFHMLKTKFGHNLRSKKFTGQMNELLLKIVAHNLCVTIQEIHELGIKADYCANNAFAQKV